MYNFNIVFENQDVFNFVKVLNIKVLLFLQITQHDNYICKLQDIECKLYICALLQYPSNTAQKYPF